MTETIVEKRPIKLLPAQRRFLLDPSQAVGVTAKRLGYGGFGSGKSLILCLMVMMRASVPGAREGLCRKHLITLKSTTLRTLLSGDGAMPPVLPSGSYRHYKADKIIALHGGGEIVYFGLDDPDKIGSYNLTGCGVDQAEELALDDWRAIEGRCRVACHGLDNWLYAVCNPSVPSHWLAAEFGLALDAKAAPGTFAVHLPTAENIHTPESYRNTLAMWTGIRRARFFEGKWVGSDGLVYDKFDRMIHVREPAGKPSRVVVGIDDGFTNPFAVVRLELDGDGRVYIAAEHYESGMNESAKVQAVRTLAAGAEAVVIDPSAAGTADALRRAGLPVVEANNDVLPGIGRVGERVVVAGDGLPRLFVHPRCTKLIAEFESYEWAKDKPKDQPVKENDHALDATRYAIMHIDHNQGSIVYTSKPPPPVQITDKSPTVDFSAAQRAWLDDDGD